MTTKEKARNYVWSKMENIQRELKDLTVEMSGERGQRISHEQLSIVHDSLDRKLDMYNYLFKLIELDEK
jgi:hypothetical protein